MLAGAAVLSEGLTEREFVFKLFHEVVGRTQFVAGLGLKAFVPHGLLLEALFNSVPTGLLHRAVYT